MAQRNLRKRVQMAEPPGFIEPSGEPIGSVEPPAKRTSRSQSVHVRENQPQPRQRKARAVSVDVRSPQSNIDNSLVVTACRLTNELITTKNAVSEMQNKYIDLLEVAYDKDRKIEKLEKELEDNRSIRSGELTNTNVRVINGFLDLEQKFQKVLK